MSDTEAWLPQPSVDAAFEPLADHKAYLRSQVHLHAGDENEAIRSVLLAEVFALDVVEEQMRHELRRPEPVEPAGRHREVGLTTDAWQTGVPGSLRRNQRAQ